MQIEVVLDLKYGFEEWDEGVDILGGDGEKSMLMFMEAWCVCLVMK